MKGKIKKEAEEQDEEKNIISFSFINYVHCCPTFLQIVNNKPVLSAFRWMRNIWVAIYEVNIEHRLEN